MGNALSISVRGTARSITLPLPFESEVKYISFSGYDKALHDFHFEAKSIQLNMNRKDLGHL